MKQHLVVDYSTYRSWKYRRREIPADIYLNEVAIFERALTKAQRQMSFYKIVKAYHQSLMKMEMSDYLRYLKRRKIEKVDDFYSHLRVFLTRYRQMSVKERISEAYIFNKKKNANREESALQKATKTMCRSIYDISVQLDSNDAIIVMREFCKELDAKPGGVAAYLKIHNIRSTIELLALVRFVIESGEDVEDII